MAGPTTAADALRWIRGAVSDRPARYFTDPHFDIRCRQRQISIQDAKYAIEHADDCQTFPDGKPTCDGTCWTLRGPDLDGGRLAVGAEAYEDTGQERCRLVTVFDG